jgi:hypothetical protein
VPDRLVRLLRGATWVLLGVLVLRLTLALFRPSPLTALRIPALPTLADSSAATNTPADASPIPPVPVPAPKPASAGATNTATPSAGSNAIPSNLSASVSPLGTNPPAKPSGTQAVASPSVAPNTPPKPPSAAPQIAGGPFPGMPPGFPFPGGPGRGRGAGAKPLDPLVQARLDKVIQGELLGPAPRPIPMALMGIAGTNAFIRTTSGMSGMVGEGGELGGVRLVRIGINRVLVNEAGTNKELTIFGGAGGESLLPKSTNQP